MTFRCATVASIAIFSVLGMRATQADTIAYTASPSTGNQVWPGNLGLDFNVISPISINALGVYDSLLDGVNNSTGIAVGIYQRIPGGDPNFDTAGILLASLTVNGTSGTVIDTYRFETLSSPLVLGPGYYSVVAQGFSDSNPNGNENIGGFTVTTHDGGGLIQFVGTGRYDSSSTLAYPTQSTANQGYPNVTDHVFAAGNFEFSAGESQPVPLPGIALNGLVLLAGFIGTKSVKRRRPSPI